MAVSASFHRNVFLLSQLVPPDRSLYDFEKIFREGMFDKPNTAGFICVSHYLLTIYDAERFQKLVEWPVMCKNSETKYRNNVKDYLNAIALENPDVGFPRVVTTHLYHASGTKFMAIMWKLSQLATRTYIMRNDEYNVVFVPKSSPASDLAKTYLQQSTAIISRNTSDRRRRCVQMEEVANSALAEEREYLSKIKTELLDKKQSLAKSASAAPIAESIKQRLTNVEDTEIISMWRDSLDENIQYIQKRNAKLKDLERVCENTSSIISNLLNDTKALDSKQLEKIDCSLLSELTFPPDVQYCLYHLYNDNNLVYHNFVQLFTLVLYQMYQCLTKGHLVNLSQCLLQVEASTEDMKSMCNVFKTFLANLESSMEETQSVSCMRGVERVSGKIKLPFEANLLLMPSPPIKINTCPNERNDIQLVQFTPGENPHKSLFTRYMRHKRNCTPDLKTNLFISRINIDSSILLDSNEKLLNMRFVTPKVKRLCKKKTEYSRLFSTCMTKNIKADSSLFLSSTAQVNSSGVAHKRQMFRCSSKLSLDAVTEGPFNLSEESFKTCNSPAQCTPIKQTISQVTSRQQAQETFDCEIKVNKPELDEFTEVQFVNDDSKGKVVKYDSSNKRASIGDLVERYKKLLEVGSSVTRELENKCTEYEIE
ncbi:PREDICTED: uncharacterized protein LOC105561552 [Vollenhovia emeryi]|uniref:uncharacterized protein LOC105561552 n=1 Tax=Vollenhovia emeryi TaxID=411798 RepID=UPI0005F40794|nr:PREDICTED: uncharacterized protein LOC105561552 [Vollenhovia emeryi]